MRKILISIQTVCFLLSLFLSCDLINAQQRSISRVVKIVALMSSAHDEYKEALEKALEGFKETLKEANIKFEINLINNIGNNDFNPKTVNEIQTVEPDLILSLGSKASYNVNLHIKDIPVVFSMVLNPNFNNLNSSYNKNITGITLSIPVIKQFSIFKEIMPNLKTIGVIYSPGENSELIREAQEAAKQLNLDLVAADVTNEREVPITLNNLIRIVDVIWMIVDRAVNSFESRKHIILEGFRNDIPVMGLSEYYVQAGAAFAVSADYKNVGVQSGNMAIKILNGNEPSQLPYEYPQKVVLYVNRKITNGIGLKIPEKILKEAIIIPK